MMTIVFNVAERQSLEGREGIDNAISGSAVRFPRCAVQKERSVGEKCPFCEKAAIPRDGVRNGLKSIG